MHKLPYELGLPVGSRSKLGLIVLQADETIEFEFWRLISGLDLALHVSRISSSSKVSQDTLMAMKKELTKAASLFPTKSKFDIVGYACTSASSVIGSETVSKMIKKGCDTRVVCNPISSLIEACKYMKVSDILFLSPYVFDVSNRLIDEIQSYGITINVVGSFNEEIEQNVARIKPRSIVEAVRELYSGQAAIFISCTNLQTLDVIEAIEQEFNCVCFSSNQVLIWNMVRLAKIDYDLRGYGKLFI
mgnify:FL=1